jgi:hypothetical protein
VVCRVVIGTFVTATVLLVAGAPSAASGPTGPLAAYYLARADPRLCPSPMCGGIWLKLLNMPATVCGDGARQEECYAASADLSRLRTDEKGRVQLQQLITEGRAVARGKLVRGLVEGFPELDTFVVSEVWTASSSPGRAQGVFRRLRDSGIRCVTTPCFSTNAAVLNTRRVEKISSVDLSRTGTPPAERRRALDGIAGRGLVAAGRILRRPGGDHAFVATQFYVRAPG